MEVGEKEQGVVDKSLALRCGDCFEACMRAIELFAV